MEATAKTLRNKHRSTQLTYLNTWDRNPMKLYAMVEVNDDQELLMNQCHHPGKIEFDKSWWTRCWNLRNDSIFDQIVDGNVMLGDYNVMYKIDKFKWSVPSHLSTLTIQPPIASPASTAITEVKNSIVDGNVMLGDYNVMDKIDKFKWSVPSHLSTLTVQPLIASPASAAVTEVKNSIVHGSVMLGDCSVVDGIDEFKWSVPSRLSALTVQPLIASPASAAITEVESSVVDGSVMLENYNVMDKIDKFKWSIPSHLSTLTIQPPIASPASTAITEVKKQHC